MKFISNQGTSTVDEWSRFPDNHLTLYLLSNRSHLVHKLSESLIEIQENEFDYTLFIRKFTYFMCFVANLTLDATESTGKNTFL